MGNTADLDNSTVLDLDVDSRYTTVNSAVRILWALKPSPRRFVKALQTLTRGVLAATHNDCCDEQLLNRPWLIAIIDILSFGFMEHQSGQAASVSDLSVPDELQHEIAAEVADVVKALIRWCRAVFGDHYAENHAMKVLVEQLAKPLFKARGDHVQIECGYREMLFPHDPILNTCEYNPALFREFSCGCDGLETVMPLIPDWLRPSSPDVKELNGDLARLENSCQEWNARFDFYECHWGGTVRKELLAPSDPLPFPSLPIQGPLAEENEPWGPVNIPDTNSEVQVYAVFRPAAWRVSRICQLLDSKFSQAVGTQILSEPWLPAAFAILEESPREIRSAADEDYTVDIAASYVRDMIQPVRAMFSWAKRLRANQLVGSAKEVHDILTKLGSGNQLDISAADLVPLLFSHAAGSTVYHYTPALFTKLRESLPGGRAFQLDTYIPKCLASQREELGPSAIAVKRCA